MAYQEWPAAEMDVVVCNLSVQRCRMLAATVEQICCWLMMMVDFFLGAVMLSEDRTALDGMLI